MQVPLWPDMICPAILLETDKNLPEYGFTINPNDPCIANSTTKSGNQLTMVWHVNDLKISCIDKFAVTKLLCFLMSIYGDNTTIHQGTSHNYLGMDLDYSEKGILKVSMTNYMDKIIEDFPEAIIGSNPSPHTVNLVNI